MVRHFHSHQAMFARPLHHRTMVACIWDWLDIELPCHPGALRGLAETQTPSFCRLCSFPSCRHTPPGFSLGQSLLVCRLWDLHHAQSRPTGSPTATPWPAIEVDRCAS